MEVRQDDSYVILIVSFVLYFHAAHAVGLVFLRGVRPDMALALSQTGPVTFLAGDAIIHGLCYGAYAPLLHLLERIDALFM